MRTHIQEKLNSFERLVGRATLPKAAVLLALSFENQVELLLTKRAANLNSHSGEIAFPGGKFDETDTDLTYTALRETHEEIGVVPQSVEIAGLLSDVTSLHQLNVTPVVGFVPNNTVITANPDEIECVFKVPISFFLDPKNRCDHLAEYREKARFAPCYLFEGHLIWGLTAYILVEFLNVVYEANIPVSERVLSA